MGRLDQWHRREREELCSLRPQDRGAGETHLLSVEQIASPTDTADVRLGLVAVGGSRMGQDSCCFVGGCKFAECQVREPFCPVAVDVHLSFLWLLYQLTTP